MKTKLFTLFVAIFATTALWASNVITYTATEKLPEVTTDGWSIGLHINAFNVAITSHEFSNGIGTITFTGEVTTIGEGAFLLCSGLTSATIPNSVTTIGEWAFSGCTGLTSITIPNSVTTIEEYAFYGCSGLTSITIPNSVTTIGISAFSNCSGLTSVTIPNSVTTIGDEAFFLVNNIVYNGTAIGSPWGAKCVNGYVDGYLVYSDASKTTLCGCSSATTGEITIPYSVTTIGDDAFAECTGLTSITIPNSVTTIGDAAFYYCSGLTSVSIPNSVTTIGDFAFSGCNNLKKVIIGSSVKVLEEYAFYGCSAIESITCYSQRPPTVNNKVLNGLDYGTIVYVPADYLNTYKMHDAWGLYDVRPIGAKNVETTEVTTSTTSNDVTITWPITDGTDTYTLTITKNGETVCVLTFNANGQLANIAFAAPGHNGAHKAPAATLTAQGYQFTVTGLNPGTAYSYNVTATDAGGQTLAEHKGNFSTTGGTGLNTLPYEGKEGIGSKYFHNGNLIIERNGIKYTATGQKVR